MIVESLIVHVLGDFYLRKQLVQEELETDHDIRNYGWVSVLIFSVTMLIIPDVDVVQAILLLLATPILNFLHKKLMIPYIEKSLYFLMETDQTFTELITKNKNLFTIMLSQLIHVVLIILINELSIALSQGVQFMLIGILFVLTLLYLYNTRKNYSFKNSVFIIIGALVIILSSIFLFYQFSAGNLYEVNNSTSLLRRERIYQQLTSYSLVLLILLRPTNLLIRKISSHYDPKNDQDHLTRIAGNAPKAAGFRGAGAMIGNLERIMILFSFISGNLIPIVAILSIKAFARYKLIVEDASFSEYFVIGTMLSVSITFVLYLLLNALLMF